MSSFKEDKNKLWKSLKDYENDPSLLEAKHHEFMEGVTDEFNVAELSGLSRRKFLAVLGASTAFAATACTDYRDKGEIIPYNKRPEEVLPGVANYYASTCNACSNVCGILIKTREGRPIKIDGNPEHPTSKGKICAVGQANILNLYDPARLTEPKINQQTSSWKEVDGDIIAALNEAQNNSKEISVVIGEVVSPTAKKVLDDFVVKYPTTKIYSHELTSDKIRREAWYECYGSYDYPSVKWNEANIILSLDSDFLGNEGNFIESLRKYTEKREVVDKVDVNRLYVAEGRLSATGMMSDYRLRIAPNKQLEFVYSLINELIKNGSSISIDSSIKTKISNASFPSSLNRDKLSHLVKDLDENRGKSIIHAGETLDKDVHIAVNFLNEILGNTAMYNYKNLSKSYIKQAGEEELKSLIQSMNSGNVGVLLHLDSNPVFTLPSLLGYSSALKNVKNVVTLAREENETSAASKYVLPINHGLESWGDASANCGVYSTQQPVISPIFNTRQIEAVLLTWLNGDPSLFNEKIYHQYLQNNFNATVYSKKNPLADQKNFWYAVLHDGIVELNETGIPKSINQSAFLNIPEKKITGGYVIHLSESYFIGDGKFVNNGWLQELPHPVSKITWDNYAALAPATAKKLGVEMSDLIEISVSGESLTIPVLIQPGLSEFYINIELGYGRTVVGEVGKGTGFNAIGLMPSSSSFIIENAAVKKVAGTYKIVSTVEHHSLDEAFTKDIHRIRKIIQEGTVKQYQKEPNFLHEKKESEISITRSHEYTGNKWAMAIDLNKCTGCNACVASCNVENNIAVVGKDQVDKSREMQWIRIDRYYSGTPEEPIVSNQPMLCQHCDNAPCENVCPVNATNHSPDGLNQMVYNRCVGTRYCSNNCPYKVRRYNFFNHRDNFADAYYDNKLTAMVHNPEVTVRSRAVMEKCTFCIQKIMEARSNAIRDGKTLNGNDIITACQQACPTTAIVFGDANDPKSEVSKLRNHNLSYHVLEELNIKPNVTYIAKLRNTHSEEVI
jgi:MoCo/4Fe-4S cofactor protein with predicted Tat translocation signal